MKTTKRKLADITGQRWFMRIDDMDSFPDTVQILRPDPDRRGAFIGPIAEVRVGLAGEDDDGEMCLLMPGEDGLVAYAVHLLPAIAKIIIEASELTDRDKGDNVARIAHAARALIDAIDGRDEELAAGLNSVMVWGD